MLIYQVKVEVIKAREQEYAKWLKPHVKDIVALKGFQRAFILRPYPAEDNEWAVFSTIYVLDSVESWESYLENHAPHFRADGVKRFGQDFRAERALFTAQEEARLDFRAESIEITSTPEGGKNMATEFNWDKIKAELNRLTNNKFANIESLKEEVNKVGQEIKSFDVHLKLSPSAQRKIKSLEKKYSTMLKSLGRAQRQVDREFNKVARKIKTKRVEAEKTFDTLKKTAKVQKQKIEKVSVDLKQKVAKARSSATGSKKKTSRKAAPKAKGSKKTAKKTSTKA